MIVRELITKLGFKVDDSQVKGFKKTVERLKTSLKGVGKAGGIAVAGLLAVTAGVTAFAFKWSAAVDDIGKTSRKIGVASDELQKLRFAAELSGASGEQLTTSVRFLLQGLFDARTKGVGPLKEGLDEIGISFKDLDGKSLPEKFSFLADAINKVADPLDRTAIRLKIFGRQGGVALGELLNTGSKGINAMTSELDDLRGVVGEAGFKAAADFNDEWTRIKATVGGVVDFFASETIPIITSLLTAFKKFIVANRELIDLKLAEWTEAIKKGFDDIDGAEVAKSVEKIIEAFKTFVEIGRGVLKLLEGMVNAFSFIVDKTGGVASALGIIGGAMVVLTGTIVALGTALGVATGGLTTLLGLAAVATTATAVAVAASGDTPQRILEQEDEKRLKQLKKRKRLVRGGGGISAAEIDALQVKVDSARKARNAKIARDTRIERVLQAGLSDEEQKSEENILNLRLKQTGTLSAKRNAAILKERRARVASDKKRKAAAKSASAARKTENKVSRESLKSQAAFLVEDDAKAFFQRLLEEGVAVAEASIRTATFRRDQIAKILQTPSTIARRVVRKKEADKEARKGANLLGTLTGGRLTSKRLGTAAKQGFGAQVLRISIQYNPTFNTPVTLRGSVKPLEASQLASIMKESVGNVIDKRNQQEFQQIIQASTES